MDPVNSNTAGSRSWAELPRDASSGVARDFPLAVEPPNSCNTSGSSRPHILPVTQVSLLLGRQIWSYYGVVGRFLCLLSTESLTKGYLNLVSGNTKILSEPGFIFRASVLTNRGKSM